jgi:hypothetical protein
MTTPSTSGSTFGSTSGQTSAAPTTGTTAAQSPRPRRRTATPVRWWVTAAAVAVPLCVFPSAAWRLSHAVSTVVNGPGACDSGTLGSVTYQTSLSVVSMGLALLTLGLVRPWGEVVPRWIPVIGSRRVPVRAATIPATVGATVLGLLTVYQLIDQVFDIVGPLKPLPPGCTPPGAEILVYYVPLVAWAPLLFLVTFHYHRRRTSVA